MDQEPSDAQGGQKEVGQEFLWFYGRGRKHGKAADWGSCTQTVSWVRGRLPGSRDHPVPLTARMPSRTGARPLGGGSQEVVCFTHEF